MDAQPTLAGPAFLIEDDRRRSEIVSLEYVAVEFDGRVYRAIQVSRMTAAIKFDRPFQRDDLGPADR